MKLSDYRGKVVLLDFWATWCEGCKEEIPWFSEFQKTNGTKSLTFMGVSMDEGGWSVVKPVPASGRACGLIPNRTTGKENNYFGAMAGDARSAFPGKTYMSDTTAEPTGRQRRFEPHHPVR